MPRDLAPVRTKSMATWCKISKIVTTDMPMVRPWMQLKDISKSIFFDPD
jgi:hypothetical protein